MSNGPQFFQTRMGQTFYEGTMPALVRQLERLNKNLEKKSSEPARKPNVRSFLDCSTAHVTEQTAKRLDALVTTPGSCFDVLTAAKEFQCTIAVSGNSEYGWYVTVPEDERIPSDVYLSEINQALLPLIAVVRHAQDLGCALIALDRDADTVPGLPVYNW